MRSLRVREVQLAPALVALACWFAAAGAAETATPGDAVPREAPAAEEHPHRALPQDAAYVFTVAPYAQEFEPPAAGTYKLAVIDTLEDHAVVDSGGASRRLLELKRGRIAVVAFVYTTCAEATGCPLAEAVLQRLDRRLAQDPELAARVRLLTVSFDPERDTPGRMRSVRGFYEPQTDWQFLTTRNQVELQPILEDFGQPVAKLYDEKGEWTGLYRHVLKVFLIDEHDRVRNIYSTGFLTPELVMNDVRTLAMDRKP